MRKLLSLIVLMLFSGGCAHNYYNVPEETYEKNVRILGVAPLFLDSASEIGHPDKEQLLPAIKEANIKNEKYLTERLRDTGTYFAVRPLGGDSDSLYTKLIDKAEKRDDAGVVYNKYFYKKSEIAGYIKEQGVDALMLVTVSGLKRQEKLYSKNYLSYLDTVHNILAASAIIINGEGTILWEYPNFRQKMVSYPALFPLQYPSFEEAEANATDEVSLKYRTVAGITRQLSKKEGYSTYYQYIFDDMAALQKKSFKLFGKKDEAKKVQDTEKQPAKP